MVSITSATSRRLRIFILAWLGVCSLSMAAELIPYSLPSQQRYSVEVRPQVQAAPATTGISEAYYQQFAQKASALQPGQRSDLQRTFTQKRDLAYAAGNVDEAQHYNRLVQIVSSIK